MQVLDLGANSGQFLKVLEILERLKYCCIFINLLWILEESCERKISWLILGWIKP